MHPADRIRLLPLALFIVLGLGCDTADPDVRDVDVCVRLGDNPDGTMTAQVDGDRFEANCFEVFTLSGNLYITARDYVETDLGIDVRGEIQLIVDDSEIGPTTIGPSSGLSKARYVTRSGSEIEATSGTITLDQFSPTRTSGSFEFQTGNGTVVRDGTFDIQL